MRREDLFNWLPRWTIALVIIVTLLGSTFSVVNADDQGTALIGPLRAGLFKRSSIRAGGLAYMGSLGGVATKSSDTELIIPIEQSVITGDDIAVAVATDPNANMVVSVHDAAGNTYVQIGDAVVNTGQLRTYLFVAYDVNSMPMNSEIIITATPAVTAHAAVAALFTGLANSDPLDLMSSTTGTSTAPSSGATSTTMQSDELLIGLIGTEGPQDDDPGIWGDLFTDGPRQGTTGGGDDTNVTISMGYRIVSEIGSYATSKSGITERDWTALIATFKADLTPDRPAIYTTGTPLSDFTILPGGISEEQSYSVSGDGLAGAITITAPADFEISLTSGSDFTSTIDLQPTSGVVPETPIYVRFNRANEGTSSGFLVHESSGATPRSIPVSGISAPLNPVEFNIMLARPTDESITANILSDYDVEFYIEHGTTSGSYSDQTSTFTANADEPIEFVIDGLFPNARNFYRIVYRKTGVTEWNTDAEHSFITQRETGSTFTFTIIADSHLGQYGGQDPDELALYEQTLQNVLSDSPDFHIDLGDTFAMDPSPLGTGMTLDEAMTAYYIQRPYLGVLTDTISHFQVLGNHENEEGWNFDDEFTAPDQSLAIVGMTARKYYIPVPIPDDFYTGNTDPLDEPIGGDTYHEDYYAWEWGDALFVVLDPFHYSLTWPDDFGEGYGGEGQDGEVSGDRWDWSLGIEQYLWLKDTLENSNAKYKFVFSHHVTGGSTPYARGGISAAPYFEWGGLNADGTWGWDDERPAAEGWDVPIHQLMVANGVDMFLHGHDHIYSYEELDGIVYLECPKPDDAGYDWEPYGYGYTEGLYPDGLNIQNSGHIRVMVSPENVTVDYVRAYLPGDGENGEVAHSFDIPSIEPETILGDVNQNGLSNSLDALIILKGDVGLDITSYCPMNCGDVNGDGFVNSTDALLVLKYDVGLSVAFPVGEPGCPSTITQPPGCEN
jgi:hypothetical protein